MPKDIVFQHPGWSLKVDNPNKGEWGWTDDVGHVVVLHRLGFDKGLHEKITDLTETRGHYRTSFAQRGIGLVECDTFELEGIPAARAIGKMLLKPHGVSYAATIALPMRRESFVFTTVTREAGITGVRETAVMLKTTHELQKQGYVLDGPAHVADGSENNSGKSIGWKNTETGAVIWWSQDPYDPDYVGPCMRNLAEAPEHDIGFPKHPLTRAREILQCLMAGIKLSDELKKRAQKKWWRW